MRTTPEFIKELIIRSEMSTLDVKGKQYPFAKAPAAITSELLKDVLSFANALNETNAYILVGVKEEKPPPHTIVGISTSIDEASLQQFVNSKTTCDVRFSYEEVAVDQCNIGVFCIPPQDGPFIVRKDFGVVKRDQVVVRTGTSTTSMSLADYTRLVREQTRHSASRDAILVDMTKNRLVHLEEVTSESTFKHCSELVRTGDLDAAMSEIDRMISDEKLWEVLTAGSRARALRTKANLLIRFDELEAAEKALDNADSYEVDKEPRIRALLSLFKSGPDAAIHVLGPPTTDDGKQLLAQFLIARGDPKAALETLPDSSPLPISCLRPKALAELLLCRTADALQTAEEALTQEPNWVDLSILAGIAHYFSALSPAFKPEQIMSPDPVPPALYRNDPFAHRQLQLAENCFTAALDKRIADHERSTVQLWLLATHALRKERHGDATALLQSLVSKDPTNNIAILWGIAYGLDFDRDQVRGSCQDNLASEKGSAADVISLLLIDAIPESDAVAFLKRYRSLFHAEGQMPIYKHWRARLSRETPDQAGDDAAVEESERVHTAIDEARNSDDWAPVATLIAENQDDSISLMMCAEALAMHDQWAQVARYVRRLTEEISTGVSYRLAATALFNIGEDRRCLKVIEEWAGRFSEEDRLPIDFWRLRSAALTRLGDVSAAIETTATLLRESDDDEDVGRAIDMHLRFGDVRSAAPFIAHLADKDQLSVADALNYSRVVQHYDEDLAVKLLDNAAAKGIPPAQTAAAYDIAERLKRVDLSRRFYESMALAADTQGTGVQAVTPDEALALFRQQRQTSLDVNEQFVRGQIPLSLACSATNQNLVLRFEAAFSAKRSSAWSDPLPVFHGSRAEPKQSLPDINEWSLCLDITALLVLDEIGLLSTLIDTVSELRIPAELPGALLELADDIVLRQPARIELLESLLAAAADGVFESSADARSPNNDGRLLRVQETDGKSAQTEGSIGLLDLVRLAVERGVIDEEEASKAVDGVELGIPGDLHLTLPEELTLVFDGSSIETATRLLGIDRLSTLATCVVEDAYLSFARDECHHAELRLRATKRITALRNSILEGLKTGTITLLAQFSPDDSRDGEIESSFDGVLFSLLSLPAGDNRVLGFDDRLINRHQSTGQNPIVCTLDIVHHLGESGALSEEDRVRAIEQLHDANLFFVPIATQDLLYLLSLCKTTDGELVETPRLRDFRRYVARCRALESWLDRNPAPGTPNEMPFEISQFRLVDRTVERLWDDPETDRQAAEARANWVWNSLYVPVAENLPVFNRTIESLRTLVGIQMCSLLTSALTTFMTSRRNDAEGWMRCQIRWAWDTCISPYVEGTPGLLSTIAGLLRHFFSNLDADTAQTASEEEKRKVRQTTRAFVSRFLVALPDPLKSEVLGDRAFAGNFGIQRVKTTHSGDVSANDEAVRASMVRAATTGEPQSLKTSGGQATVELTRRGSIKKPALITISGAMSMLYQEPLLGILSGNRAKNLRAFSVQSKWIDLPVDIFADLMDELESLSDLELFDRLDTIRNESASPQYDHLASLMAQEEPMDGSVFDAPPTASLLRMLRLPTRSRKRASFLIDFAAESLIGQYGPMIALERLAGLPVDLASRFVDAFEASLADKPRATKSWLLSAEGSVLFRLHKLAVASSLSARKLFGTKSIRAALRQLLDDWPTHSDLFIQILSSTDRDHVEAGSEPRMQTSQRLVTTWTHAHYVASIIHANTEALKDATQYFRSRNQQSLGAALDRDDTFELDVSTPDLLGPHVLLFYAMDYIHAQSSQILTAPLLREVGVRLKFVDTPESPLSPRLLQQREAGHDCLDSFLKAVDMSFSTAFNGANPSRAWDRNWFSNRRFDIRKGVLPDFSDAGSWMEVLAHEQRWLDEKTRSTLVSGFSKMDWPRLLSESEDGSICTLLVIADMISYIPNETEAIERLQDVLVRCNNAAPVKVGDLAGRLGKQKMRLPHMYAEAIYRSARSRDVARSCRVLAAGFSTLIQEQDGLAVEIVDLLGVCVPMLPVEHVQPLVTLRNRLMCNTVSA